MSQKLAEVWDGGGAMGGDAKAGCHAQEVNAGFIEIHPDVTIRLGGEGFHCVGTLFEDPVRGIVDDDEDDRDVLPGGGPQALDGVEGAAVADQGHDRTVR